MLLDSHDIRIFTASTTTTNKKSGKNESPLSQMVPAHPGVHSQMYVLPDGLHVAPFLHALDRQGFGKTATNI